MARLIRFDLPMNGKKITNLDELGDNMTVEIIGHYKTGLLAKWLRVRGHDEHLAALGQIAESDDASLLKAICSLFDVEVDDFIVAALLEPAKPSDGDLILTELELQNNSNIPSADFQEDNYFYFSDSDVDSLLWATPENKLLEDVRSQRLPIEMQNKLVELANDVVQIKLASNAFLANEAQMAIAQTGTPEAREALAANPALSPSVQAYLANNGNQEVKLILAENPSICQLVQNTLAGNNELVRYYLAKNNNITAQTQLLLMDFDSYYGGSIKQELAQKNPLLDELQERLITENDYAIRRNLARNTSLKQEFMLILADDLRDEIKMYLASNSNLPESIQSRIIRNSHAKIILELAKNMSLGVAQQAKLAETTDIHLLASLFNNPSLHQKVKNTIIKRYTEQEALNHLAALKNELNKKSAEMSKNSKKLHNIGFGSTIFHRFIIFDPWYRSERLHIANSKLWHDEIILMEKIKMFESILDIKKHSGQS